MRMGAEGIKIQISGRLNGAEMARSEMYKEGRTPVSYTHLDVYKRQESISMKNLIIFARKRGGKSMADKLAAEIMDAFNAVSYTHLYGRVDF